MIEGKVKMHSSKSEIYFHVYIVNINILLSREFISPNLYGNNTWPYSLIVLTTTGITPPVCSAKGLWPVTRKILAMAPLCAVKLKICCFA